MSAPRLATPAALSPTKARGVARRAGGALRGAEGRVRREGNARRPALTWEGREHSSALRCPRASLPRAAALPRHHAPAGCACSAGAPLRRAQRADAPPLPTAPRRARSGARSPRWLLRSTLRSSSASASRPRLSPPSRALLWRRPSRTKRLGSLLRRLLPRRLPRRTRLRWLRGRRSRTRRRRRQRASLPT
jgi:hypothetical protein